MDLDPDPDPDPHSDKLLDLDLDPDPDPHKMNADPQPCYYRLDDVELGGDCPGYWQLPGPLLL